MRKKDRVNINSAGGPIFLGKVNNIGTIKGRSDKTRKGLNADEAGRLFGDLFNTIERRSRLSIQDKADLKTELEEIRTELGKKEKANEGFVMRRLRNIKRMAPDILEITLAIITNPAAGFGAIAKKIAEKVKATAT